MKFLEKLQSITLASLRARAKQWETNASKFLTKVLKLLSLIAMALVAFSTVKKVFQVKYSLVPFHVPVAFSDTGGSGEYLIWQLNDELAYIQEYGWSINGLYLDIKDQTEIQDDVMIFGNSLNGTISIIRDILGIENRTITGALVNKGDTLLLRVAIKDMPTIVTEVSLENYENDYHAYDDLLKIASKNILKQIDPFVLASYFWARGEHTNFLEIVNLIIGSEHENSDQAYLLWGEFLFEQQQYELAADKFELAVTLSPRNTLALTGWGAALTFSGEFETAISKFKKSSQIDSENWQTWYKWAVALAFKEQHVLAVNKFKQALELAPDIFNIYNQLAYSLMALDRFEESKHYLMLGINNATETAYLHATLSEVYWLEGNQDVSFKHINIAIDQGFDIGNFADVEPYSHYLMNFPREGGLKK